MSSTDFTLNVIAALNKQLSKKQLQSDLKSMNDSMYVRVIAKLTTALSKQQLKKDLKKLNDLYVQIGTNVKVDKDTKTQLQNKIQELQKSLSELEVNLKVSKAKTASEIESVRKEVQAKAKKAPIEFDIEVKRSKAIADIEYLGKRFSKLFTNVAAKQKYENILGSAYSISDETQLKSVRNQIAAFTSELKANGLASQSLGDKWRGLIERTKNLFSAASIVTTIFTQVKQAVSTFIQLDTAMTNLYKVTDDITSRDQFSGLLTKWNKLAQNLAVTTQSLIDATAEWSKIGFDLDMSEQLAQITAIFEKTAEISTEKASSTLISAAQAFTEIGNLGEDDYIARVEAIGDRINAVGNQYSISSEGIADGLQNASAALKLAGNDLDETIALITAANKIFQSPSEVSNMLKVASMRLRGQVDALEEMGEDATGVSADITKIQQQIYELTGNKVNIFEDEDTLKSTYQMILEIGEVFDSLNDRSQADLLEVMFGKQRASAGASLLLNYEELEKIKNDSMNAANSMAEEYSKYMESAEAHITIFKEKLVETYSTFMGGDLIKYTADVGSGILDLVNATDLLKHGILAVLALKIGQSMTTVGAAIASTSNQMNTLGNALQQIKKLPTDSTRIDALEKIGNETKNLTEKNLKLLLSQKQLGDSDKTTILSMHNLTEEEAQLKLEKMGLTTATNTQSAANVTEAATTTTLKGAMTSLKASIVGVGTSIKAAFMSNPIGFILTGITTIVSIATTVISKNNQALEEARQKAKEAADEANTLGDEIAELAGKYISLSEAVKTDESAKEDLMSTQTELLKKLGLEGESIDDLTAKYGSLSKAINQMSIDTLKDAQIDLIAGVSAARDELLDVAKDNFWGTKNIINATGKDAIKAFKELEKAGIVSSGSYGSAGGSFALLGDEKTVEGALENFKKLEDAINALRDSEAFTVDELTNNSLFKAIYKRYSEMKEGVDSYRSAIENLNENLSQQTMLAALQGNEIPKTEEAFETFKQELIDTAIASKQFIGNEKEIADAINAYLASVPDFEGFYSIPLEKELDKVDELLSQVDFSPISFDQAWAASFTSEKEAVKNLGDSLLDLAEKGRLTIETFNNTDSTDYFKNLGISAEEAVSKINKLVDESSQISSMSKQLSSIANALGSKRDDGFVSADTLSGFDTEVRGLDSWDKFQEVLGSTTSSYQECEEAANALAAEWVNNNDFLAQLTEQNKEYYATQLKAMGIENYEEIIAYAQNLNSAKEALSQASFDLATATSEEIQALIGEEEYTELAQQQIWNLILAKQTAEGASLDTADDCQRLLNLAQNAGVTGKAIELLTELMSIYSNLAHGIYGTNSEVLKEITTRAESIKQNILNLLSDNSSEPVELKPHIKFSPKTKSDASSAGKDAAKAFTDALDKELAALDKKMEAGYIDFNEYIQARLALIENYYNQGKLSADEYYSYLEKHYDTQLSYMDKVVNAVTRRIDAELDALKQQKEDVENIYKVQIESLEKEKTLLEEANKERQRQIDLQKSLYDLERARNQRTKLIYSEDKGMHYVVDDDSIRSAQEDVDNARYDIKIAEIDKTISNLEETRDKQTNAIDEMISNLESYKNAWNDVTSAYEEEQENLIAAQVLGANWEADILNSRLDVLNDFKNEYMSIQQAMVDAAWKSANEQVKAAKEAEKGSSGSTYKAPKIDDTTDTSQPSKTGGGGNGSSLALLGGNRVTSLLNFKAYESGTNNAKRGLNLVGEDGTETYFDNHGHVAIVTKPTLIPMEGGEVVKNERDTKKLLDSDNLSSTNTIGLADIDGKEAEYTIKVNVETNGELPDVKDASSTKKKTITLPDGRVWATVSHEELIQKLLQEAPTLSKQVQAEQMYPKMDSLEKINQCATSIGRNMEDMMNPMHIIAHNMQEMTGMDKHINNINNVSSVINNTRNMQPIVNHISVTLPNVTNSTSAEALMRDLQSLNTKKFQVDWNK